MYRTFVDEAKGPLQVLKIQQAYLSALTKAFETARKGSKQENMKEARDAILAQSSLILKSDLLDERDILALIGNHPNFLFNISVNIRDLCFIFCGQVHKRRRSKTKTSLFSSCERTPESRRCIRNAWCLSVPKRTRLQRRKWRRWWSSCKSCWTARLMVVWLRSCLWCTPSMVSWDGPLNTPGSIWSWTRRRWRTINDWLNWLTTCVGTMSLSTSKIKYPYSSPVNTSCFKAFVSHSFAIICISHFSFFNQIIIVDSRSLLVFFIAFCFLFVEYRGFAGSSCSCLFLSVPKAWRYGEWNTVGSP